MQFKTKAILVALILASATNTFAASTADLKVIGNIIPGSCTPTFFGGGVVDYGKMSAGDLSSTVSTALPQREITYTITCKEAITIGTSWTDNRAATSYVAHIKNFGLNLQGTSKIGFYTISHRAGMTRADNTVVDTIVTNTNGATWTAAASMVDTKGSQIYSFAKLGELTPTAYRFYSGVLSVNVSIAPTETLDIGVQVLLDGLATMEVRYL